MYKRIENCSQNPLKGLKKDLTPLEKGYIGTIIKQDKTLSKSVSLATSVSGVGKTTAISLLVTTNEFKTGSSAKQLASYVDVVPLTHQLSSSIKCKTSVSTFANKRLKTLLHMCVISARTHAEEFRKYFEKKIAEGKHAMCILNAIRNKIVQRIYACVTKGRVYETNFQNYLQKS